MTDRTARTQAWLADLAAINAEIDAHGLPLPAPRTPATPPRKLKPLGEA